MAALTVGRVDGWSVACAASTAAGALAATPTLGWFAPGLDVPLGMGAGAVGVAAAVLRSRLLICVGLGLLAACLGQRSVDGLEEPPVVGPVQAEVTLVSDPEPARGGGVRADVRLGHKRLALLAYRSPAAALVDRLAGEKVIVAGEVRSRGHYERRMIARHLAGRLDVDAVVGWREGHGVTRAANTLRGALANGASSLSQRHQSLLTGLVLGDDRHQPPEMTQAFRDAGLSHLLAVSGGDVAVVLALAGPVLSRMRLAPRLLLVLGLLGLYALMTRGEPSVLRSTAMAALGAYAATTGRPVTGLRRLTLAVTVLLLIDPLLVTSLGFQLSVAGTLGIIAAGQRIANVLPGPAPLARAMAITIAAQIGVAPLLISTFGSLPVVALPANLVAGTLATAAKWWGLGAGLLAGAVGEPAATVLHLPTRVLLWLLDGVAVRAAAAPLGELRLGHAIALGCALTLIVLARRRLRGWPAVAARGLSIVTVLGLVFVSIRPGPDLPDDGEVRLGPGMQLWRAGEVSLLAIDGRADDRVLVDELRRQGVRQAQMLVVRTPAVKAAALAAGLAQRWPGLRVYVPAALAADGPMSRGVVVPADGSRHTVGRLQVTFESDPDRLRVAVHVHP